MAKEAKSILNMDVEKAQETPMVELAYDLLKKTKQSRTYHEIMDEVAKARAMTPEEITENIAQLYTEINIDGRFLFLGNNSWGLKRWYPVDKTAEKADKKFVRKEDDFDDDDDDFLEDELEEEDLDYNTEDDEDEEADGFTEVDVEDEDIEEVDEEFDDEDAEDADEDAADDEDEDFK